MAARTASVKVGRKPTVVRPAAKKVQGKSVREKSERRLPPKAVYPVLRRRPDPVTEVDDMADITVHPHEAHGYEPPADLIREDPVESDDHHMMHGDVLPRGSAFLHEDVVQEEEEEEDPPEPRAVVKSGKLLKSKKVARKEVHSLQTVFDLNEVDSPLVGTPKEVQEELDGLALKLQDDPEDQEAFERILTYIHRYLLGLVFKKYNFVKGNDETDMYQEALIALFKKAVPNFDPTRNMSFLNFAKMCINRHLITILHASKHRRKDMPLNTAISMDHNPNPSDDDDSCCLSNILPDEKTSSAPHRDLSKKESYQRTLDVIRSALSPFEIIVLDEYLAEKSYREAARSVTRRTGLKYNEKSVDNALLRIRKKALEILRGGDIEDVPLLF